ncbi:MAG: hypothetical protein A2Z18_02360 [Armatimonadetes bacterium RBG_16_58_9]|nr:MAG: hypothetical protein A2Z18_02360 [Armatimonadetes bacterium RBG_16_58_9]
MIERDPQRAASRSYDLIVVGGGIMGASVLLEAARRGLRCLLLERDDFGGATSWNSLRILHGGLRYLQTADLGRFCESARERRWFCQYFPDLVRPLPCLMPLYGKGLKRLTTFGIALATNDWLSRHRNVGIHSDLCLPNGRVLSVAETIDEFALVDRQGLQGGGLWYDVVMISPQRILMEIIRWACALGGSACNYVEVMSLLVDAAKVVGVNARDRISWRGHEFHGDAVINCTGPWCRSLVQPRDGNRDKLFQPSLAFNLLLNREPVSEAGLAIQSRCPASPVYFLLPLRNRILAGTAHRPWTEDVSYSQPSGGDLDAFIADLNSAVRDLRLTRGDILRVYSGLIPATKRGSTRLAKRPVICVHSQHGGPRGFVSVCGIKYTTARLVAERALQAIYGKRCYGTDGERPQTENRIRLEDADGMLSVDDALLAEELKRLVKQEAVVYVDDLLFRRTGWCDDPKTEQRVRGRIARHLQLDGGHRIDSDSR